MNYSKTKFPPQVEFKYDIYEFRHAATILKNDFTAEYAEIIDLLENFQVSHEDIITPGGRKSPIASKFDNELYSRGWLEKKWDISISIDGDKRPSPTHSVDYYKNNVAVELEWNNKDPFFDRDLNNFRLLHELKVISVGVIVTRADELQELFKELGRGASFGASTTHYSKLLPKITGGGAAECPLLIFTITKNACVKEIAEKL